jgi:hypothetical protein
VQEGNYLLYLRLFYHLRWLAYVNLFVHDELQHLMLVEFHDLLEHALPSQYDELVGNCQFCLLVFCLQQTSAVPDL